MSGVALTVGCSTVVPLSPKIFKLFAKKVTRYAKVVLHFRSEEPHF